MAMGGINFFLFFFFLSCFLISSTLVASSKSPSTTVWWTCPAISVWAYPSYKQSLNISGIYGVYVQSVYGAFQGHFIYGFSNTYSYNGLDLPRLTASLGYEFPERVFTISASPYRAKLASSVAAGIAGNGNDVWKVWNDAAQGFVVEPSVQLECLLYNCSSTDCYAALREPCGWNGDQMCGACLPGFVESLTETVTTGNADTPRPKCVISQTVCPRVVLEGDFGGIEGSYLYSNSVVISTPLDHFVRIPNFRGWQLILFHDDLSGRWQIKDFTGTALISVAAELMNPIVSAFGLDYSNKYAKLWDPEGVWSIHFAASAPLMPVPSLRLKCGGSCAALLCHDNHKEECPLNSTGCGRCLDSYVPDSKNASICILDPCDTILLKRPPVLLSIANSTNIVFYSSMSASVYTYRPSLSDPLANVARFEHANNVWVLYVDDEIVAFSLVDAPLLLDTVSQWVYTDSGLTFELEASCAQNCAAYSIEFCNGLLRGPCDSNSPGCGECFPGLHAPENDNRSTSRCVPPAQPCFSYHFEVNSSSYSYLNGTYIMNGTSEYHPRFVLQSNSSLYLGFQDPHFWGIIRSWIPTIPLIFEVADDAYPPIGNATWRHVFEPTLVRGSLSCNQCPSVIVSSSLPYLNGRYDMRPFDPSTRSETYPYGFPSYYNTVRQLELTFSSSVSSWSIRTLPRAGLLSKTPSFTLLYSLSDGYAPAADPRTATSWRTLLTEVNDMLVSCGANCSLVASSCAQMNREECSFTPQTCGSCLVGFESFDDWTSSCDRLGCDPSLGACQIVVLEKDDSYTLTQDCSDLGSIPCLDNYTSAFNILKYSSVNFGEIPRYYFASADLVSLELDACNATLADGLVFAATPNLSSIALTNVALGSLGALMFYYVPSLTTLVLERCALTSLDVLCFHGLPSLGTLSLSGNMLTSLPSRVFANLPSLTHLNVSGNPFSGTFSSAFPSNLLVLDMSFILSIEDDLAALKASVPLLQNLTAQGCQISSLKGISFPSALLCLDLSSNTLSRWTSDVAPSLPSPPSLQTLILRGNMLTSVDGASFPRSLVFLDLSHNLLLSLSPGTFASLSLLTQLNLDGNNLGAIPALPSNLISLSMAHAGLTQALGVWPGGAVLASLDLRNNSITSLDAVDLFPLSALEKLNLEGNKINVVQRAHLFGQLPFFKQLCLGGGPPGFDCCSMQALSLRNVTDGCAMPLICSSPPSLSGGLFSSFRPPFFECVIDCGALSLADPHATVRCNGSYFGQHGCDASCLSGYAGDRLITCGGGGSWVDPGPSCSALPSSSAASSSSSSLLLIVIVAVMFLVAIAAVAFLIIYYVRRNRSDSRARRVLEEELAMRTRQYQSDDLVPAEYLEALKGSEEAFEALEVLPAAVEISETKLGDGAFGRVMKGFVTVRGKRRETAIKLLKEDATPHDVVNFVLEGRLMCSLRHDGLLAVVAMVTSSQPIMLITEFMERGSLKVFLRSCRPEASPRTKELTRGDFVDYALQIAAALVFLEARKVVHRDLAARNILVSSDFKLKIADFGLSRLLGTKDYYRKVSDDVVPVKWMPPEAVKDRIYTAKSDVWSFGIVLYELTTLGDAPYPKMAAVEAVNAVARGYR